MFLLEEIDEEYEEALAIRIAQHVEAEQSFEAEIRYTFGDENDADHIEASTSNSGLSVPIDLTVHVAEWANKIRSIKIQADSYKVTTPPVRKVKVCTDEIKTALFEMSFAAQILPEKA